MEGPCWGSGGGEVWERNYSVFQLSCSSVGGEEKWHLSVGTGATGVSGQVELAMKSLVRLERAAGREKKRKKVRLQHVCFHRVVVRVVEKRNVRPRGVTLRHCCALCRDTETKHNCARNPEEISVTGATGNRIDHLPLPAALQVAALFICVS